MSVWKQLSLSVVILLAAFVLWGRLFSGAPEILARWNLEWIAPASPEHENATVESLPAPEAAAVVTSAITSATINDRLTSIGTSRALNSVSIVPFSAGRLTEILTESGAHIAAGDVIARLDAETEEIALDRARIALEDAEARLERYKTLRNTVSAVQLTEAELAVSNASLALRDAELALERRSIRSPISGVVGILPVSVGNYVTTQTVVATVDDRSRIVVDFWAPERFAGMISVGQPVSATSVARPDDGFAGIVSAVDNRIDAKSRTLQVQASIDNENDLLRAGMSFQIEMHFPGDTYPSVNPLAVQWGADGAFVWLIENGTARRVPVRVVQRNTDNILVSGDLGIAGMVVTEGIHAVREGAPVRLVGGETGAASAPAVTGS